MSQTNLIRSEFQAWETITTPANSAVQPMAFTGYYKAGDVVDVIDVDANNNILSTLVSGATVAAIIPDVALIFTAIIDTTGVTGTAKVVGIPIDDGQEAIDRLYRRDTIDAHKVIFERSEPVLSSVTIGGTKLRLFVADSSFYEAGDTVSIVGTDGVPVTGVTVESVSVQADDTGNKSYIQLTTNPDISGITSPVVALSLVSINTVAMRLMSYIDNIDMPKENIDLGVGDGKTTVFAFPDLFRQGSSKVFIDGNRSKLGTAGTRAVYTHGTSDAAITVTSMVLGLKGDSCKLEITTTAGAPTVTVTGNYNSGFTVSVNNNSGAATAQEICDAINADSNAKVIMQAVWGGNGTGLPAALSATNLAGGLNDGTGDYAELEQVYENTITLTGYKFIAFWILPAEKNRMNAPLQQSEELVVDYRMLQFNK